MNTLRQCSSNPRHPPYALREVAKGAPPKGIGEKELRRRELPGDGPQRARYPDD